jgi:hypothetical protein
MKQFHLSWRRFQLADSGHLACTAFTTLFSVLAILFVEVRAPKRACNTTQREDALGGEVDTNKQNGHGHPLASGEHVRFRNPIVAPSSDVALGSNRRASGWNGDVPFIRWAFHKHVL